jgi:hypothetical protein
MTMAQVHEMIGAGEGNRTIVISLEGFLPLCRNPAFVKAFCDFQRSPGRQV